MEGRPFARLNGRGPSPPASPQPPVMNEPLSSIGVTRSHDPAQLLLGTAEGVPLVPVETFGPDATPMMTAVREPPVCGEWSYDDRELEEPIGGVLSAITSPPPASMVPTTIPPPSAVTPVVASPPMPSPQSPPQPPPPADPFTALCERVDALGLAQRYEAAETVLRDAALLRPDAPEIALHTGILACRRARWRDAVPPLRSAITRLPEHAGAHYHLGEALNKCDDLPGALAAYLRAVELDPGLWRALKGVGIVYDRLGKPEAAAPFYRRARDAQRA